jgi:hypothetical protein
MTVTEKEHFKARLNEKVQELINELTAENPTWHRDVVKEAVERSEQHFNISDKLKELDSVRATHASLEEHISQLETEIVATMRGLAPEDTTPTSTPYRYSTRPDPAPPFVSGDFERYPHDAKQLMQSYVSLQFEQLAKVHPHGKRIHELKEKANTFKDMLLMAGTPAQLQQTWKEIINEFNIIAADTGERRLRKVETARNTPKAKSKK